MRVGIVAEQPLDAFEDALDAAGCSACFVDIRDVVLSVRNGNPEIAFDHLDGLDGIYLHLPSQFMLFVEPLLGELAESGVYCQLKPTAFNMLASAPLLHVTLAQAGISVPRTILAGDQIESAIADVTCPAYVEIFQGLSQIQRIFLEDESVVRSFLKSMPSRFDIMAVREFVEGDLNESLVIGNEVHTVQRKWNRQKLQHGRRRLAAKLPDAVRKTVLRACSVAGTDVAVVKTIGGKVLQVEQFFDFDDCGRAYNVDVCDRIARLYAGRLA